MILLLTTGYVIDMYAQSQTIEVTGMVRDAEKIPLAGVNISVKNVAGLGVITNIDGEYKIKIAPYSTLIFSYIGFETQEVLIKDNMSKIDVTLRESSASVIDEVVITGTGAQKKITMTGQLLWQMPQLMQRSWLMTALPARLNSMAFFGQLVAQARATQPLQRLVIS